MFVYMYPFILSVWVHMYVCIYVHTFMCAHMCAYTCACACVWVYVHICIWVFTWVCVHICIACMWIYVCTCLQKHVYMYMCVDVHMCACLCECVHVWMCVCVHVCMWLNVCVCVYVHMWICLPVNVCVYMHLFVNGCICRCMCICVSVCGRHVSVTFNWKVLILILKSEQGIGPQDNPPLWVSSVSQHGEEPWRGSLSLGHPQPTCTAYGEHPRDFQSSGFCLSASWELMCLVPVTSSFCYRSWDCCSMLCCVCFPWTAKCALEKGPGREVIPWSLHSVRCKAE